LAFKLGVIGYGTIASLALDCLARELAAPLDAVICLARENAEARAAAMSPQGVELQPGTVVEVSF
jgi:pyrroline-5-carboxylate reductase